MPAASFATGTRGDAGLSVQFEQFSLMCREIEAALDNTATQRQVIDNEVARVLEKTIANTGKASEEKIVSRVLNRAVFTVNGKKVYVANIDTGKGWHVSDAVWGQVIDQQKQSLARKLAKIGLSKNSWYLIAQAAGFEISAPSYVKNARTTTTNQAADVSIARDEQTGAYSIEISNSMPVLRSPYVNGAQALFSAVVGRQKFFENNVAKGVFDSIDAIAQKYPGIQTNAVDWQKIEEALVYE